MRTTIALLSIAAALLVGCVTFQTTSGKILASSALTVDGAMKGWAVWVARGQATPPQENAVKGAYQKYQAAMAIACNAYTNACMSGDQSAWATAESVLMANQAALLALVTKFQTQTITP